MKKIKYEEPFEFDKKDGPKKNPKKGCLYYLIYGLPLWCIIGWVIHEIIKYYNSL